ncbi:hypothetical protein SNE40_013114 [Patella caerulea]|uniref:Uncharacterized protein n=1 Tax=Patella caerulea TaxID=87958 RepID=A0AAN8JKA2_PATCE
MGKKRKSTVTRQESAKKFCGLPTPLDKTEPPTLRQVIQYSYFVKNSQPGIKNYDISKMIAKVLIEIWRSVNPRLPLYDEYYIVKKVDKSCFKKAKEINRKSLSSLHEQNLEEKLDRLFDISSCICKLPIRPCDDKTVKCSKVNCQVKHIVCTCPPKKKVPLEEREYLKDQGSKIGAKGSFQLGSVDKEAVKRDQRAAAEAARLQIQIRKQQELNSVAFASTSSQNIPCSSEESGRSSCDEEEYIPERTPSGAYSFLKTARYAMELIRADLSSNVGASLANAFLMDLKAANLLVPDLNVEQIIVDKSKLDREKARVKLKSETKYQEGMEKLICVGIDGKVDRDTLMYTEVQDEDGTVKLRKDRGAEHHLTFTNEPGTESGTYLTHRVITLAGATGDLQGEEAASVLEEFDSVDTLKAVLVDNTSTNTGWENGLVTCLENKIGRKLHTIGCSLHQNELPFRAVFKHLDGSTKSPAAFSGPLGKLCGEDYHHLPQVDFDKLSGPLDNMDISKETLNDLSSDQRLLLEYVWGISKGEVNPKHAAWKIGPLNHARWLTLAIRLMCLWTRGAYPPDLKDKLQVAIKYIVEVYAVSWFEIKKDCRFHSQQLYLYNGIQRMKQQSEEIQSVVFHNLKFNAFALLPENVLYSMVKSDELDIRETGIKKILSIRKGKAVKKRLKRITAINTEATHWSELIKLSQPGICEPALTEHLSDEQLQESLLHGDKLELIELPSHSQSVERAVKLVSEASGTVYGLDSRHKHIQAKVLSRRMRPSFVSKGYYTEKYDDLGI